MDAHRWWWSPFANVAGGVASFSRTSFPRSANYSAVLKWRNKIIKKNNQPFVKFFDQFLKVGNIYIYIFGHTHTLNDFIFSMLTRHIYVDFSEGWNLTLMERSWREICQNGVRIVTREFRTRPFSRFTWCRVAHTCSRMHLTRDRVADQTRGWTVVKVISASDFFLYKSH